MKSFLDLVVALFFGLLLVFAVDAPSWAGIMMAWTYLFTRKDGWLNL